MARRSTSTTERTNGSTFSGELTFWIDGETTIAREGSFVYGPRDVPHTFAVTSEEARFLLVVEPAGFENFMLALSEPAQSLTLPTASAEPPALDEMMAAAAPSSSRSSGHPESQPEHPLSGDRPNRARHALGFGHCSKTAITPTHGSDHSNTSPKVRVLAFIAWSPYGAQRAQPVARVLLC